MPTQILMPALSPTMTEGKLARWLKAEGDTVKSGELIAEIETDKATMEVEAVDEGTLGRILVPGGTEGVAVNTPIALLLGEGEDAAALQQAPAARPSATAAAAPESPAGAAPAPAAPAPASASAAAASAPVPASQGQAGGRIFASPLARRMAEQAGLDLSRIQGSGPHGRIVKADIEAAKAAPKAVPAPAAAAAAAAPTPVAAAPAAAPAAPAPARAPAAGPDARKLADLLSIPYRAEPLSGMRKGIARRLSESKQTVPHFYLTVEVRLDPLLALRTQLNDRAKGAYKLSVNDLLIKACAKALIEVPAANASYTDDAILYYNRADVSVAVATPSGLITPIIKDAAGKSLSAISNEMKDLAARARDGKLKPEEYQGGTFSLSNLGMFGISHFAAIINPPQGCILAVGAGEKKPVVGEGDWIEVATMMSATLSVDHRVVDGAVGAEFLAALKAIIQDPLSMLV